MQIIDRAVAKTSNEIKAMMTQAGYHPAHTGGGCMTWEKVEGDQYVWICSGDNSLDGDKGAKDWLIGLYGPDGQFLTSHEAYTLDEAVVLAPTLPRDLGTWKAWAEANPVWFCEVW